MSHAKVRQAAVAYCRALIEHHGVTADDLQLSDARTPPPRAAERALKAPVRRTPPAPPKTPVTGRVAPARPARLECVAPSGRAPTVVIPSPSSLRSSVDVVMTDQTKHTICPSIGYDPRYQLDPSQPVAGAGFVAEWAEKRGRP